MKIYKILLYIFFEKSNINIYNNLKNIVLNKIRTKDYTVFDSSKEYTIVSLFLYEYTKTISCTINDYISNNKLQKKDKWFEVHCENKTFYSIILEIEENIKRLLNFPCNEKIVLLYSHFQYTNSLLLKQVIEDIKKENKKRQFRKKGFEIYYESIDKMNCSLHKLSNEIKAYNSINEYKLSLPIFPITYLKYENDHAYYFRFCIKENNFSYLFEFNINKLDNDELNNYSEIKTSNLCTIDEKITNILLRLFHINDINYIDTLSEVYSVSINPNEIEIKYPYYFKLEIKATSISFKIISMEYVYYVKSNENCDHLFYFITPNIFIGFKDILKKFNLIKNEDNTKCIEFLYRLLNYHNKVEFLITRILNNSMSALNYIICHLLQLFGVLDKNELDIITGQMEDTNNNIVDQKNKIVKALCGFLAILNIAECFLIKICLLLELEQYFNENNLSDDIIIRSLKDINVLINSMKNEEGNKFKTEVFDIIKIVEELKRTHVDNIIIYKKDTLKNICKLISLFTGLKISTFVHQKTKEIFSKNEIIKNLQLNESKIDKDIKLIKNILSINTALYIKYEEKRKLKEEEIKNIGEILKKSTLDQELNAINIKALDKDVLNLFDDNVIQNFFNKLMNEGQKIIDKIFNEYVNKQGLPEDSIKEYKNKVKDFFEKALLYNIEVKLQKQAPIELYRVLVGFFITEIYTRTIVKAKWEIILGNIKTILNEMQILKFINEEERGKSLHDTIIKHIYTTF
ncbi:uncharacterized protein VNE69_02212 [Vairimorpha necatrix]|uniref:Uncharacterized protein n=1 Tax=Vairimorpha necatrix TaxID=6039 RepID=A0AAX4J9R7_9MICR